MTTSDDAQQNPTDQQNPATLPAAEQPDSGGPARQTATPVLTTGGTPILPRRGTKAGQVDPRLVPSHQLTPEQVQQLSQMGEDVPGTWNRAMQDKYGAEEQALRQTVTEQSASDAQSGAIVEMAVNQFRARKLAEERGDTAPQIGPPPTETVPGGAYQIGGQWVDANGHVCDAPPPRPAAKLPDNAFQEHPSPVPGQAPQAFAQPANR
jgi:hypothetical protein